MHTADKKKKQKQNKKHSTCHMTSGLQQRGSNTTIGNTKLRKRLSSSNAFRKGTVHKRRRCRYEHSQIIGFHHRESPLNLHTMPSTRKRQEVCRHCQVQPINARPRVFTPEIETRYSKSTTRNEVTKYCLPHLPRTLLQNTKHQAHSHHTQF